MALSWNTIRMCAAALGTAGLLWLAAPAGAALQWQAPETLPGGVTSIALGPDGVALMFGFATIANLRLVVRPAGGPSGAPQDLPVGMGSDGTNPPVVGWFPDGSSLIADPPSDQIAFRPAGAAASIGTPQNLGSGASPVVIATAASGEALIGLAGARVASRSAGPGGSVDVAHAQSFGGRLIGLALDPDGAAVVVYVPTGTNTLSQAVRHAGDTTFGTPTAIPAPGLYRPFMAAAPTGHAVLSWMGGPGGTTGYGTQVTVATRAPGGAFGGPQVIGTEPAGEPTSVLPGVTSSGDGIVGWSGGVVYTNCSNGSGNDSDHGGFVATSHNGFGAPTALGNVAWPTTSATDAVASAGDHVLVAFNVTMDPDPKCDPPIGDSTESFVRTGASGPSGLGLDAPVSMMTELSNGHGQYYAAAFAAMAINPSGVALYAFSQYSGSGPGVYVRALEDRSALPTTTTTTVTSTTSTTLRKKACRKSCRQDAAACRRACPGTGKTRRTCRKACTTRGKGCGAPTSCRLPPA